MRATVGKGKHRDIADVNLAISGSCSQQAIEPEKSGTSCEVAVHVRAEGIACWLRRNRENMAAAQPAFLGFRVVQNLTPSIFDTCLDESGDCSLRLRSKLHGIS